VSYILFQNLGRFLGWGAAVFLMTAGAQAQISPGPLSRAHQTLEGATKCASCHNFGTGNRGLKCLDCHGEIHRQILLNRGLHALAYKASASQEDCARCHLEHNGRQFPITQFDKQKFDHAGLTRFALEGKHRELACSACHSPVHIQAAFRADIKMKDLNRTYLGMGRECTDCHRDPHNGQLDQNCTHCHSQDVWKPAGGFNHSRTAYALTGMHRDVACEKCHAPAPGHTEPKYKGVVFASCRDCHNDPHHGAFETAKFSRDCQGCHTTGGWKTIASSSGFDHENTVFPLRGKHAEIACAKCHKGSDFHEPVPHAVCKDCHEDVHRGQFDSRKAGSDCSACHNEISFKPSLFTKEMHQAAFRLEGKHAALECEKCHEPAGKEAVYEVHKLTCVACHADPHGGEFAGGPYTNKCEECHTQDKFGPTTFIPARHAKTKFPLTAAHAAVLCVDCHKPLQGAATEAARQYHFTNQSCTTCHADPHHTTLACESCHNEHQWKELKPFDHASTKFALEGAHQSVACAGCHASKPSAASAKAAVDFSHTPLECSGCHEDIHGGQFMSAGKEKECSTCHNLERWGAAVFDHNQTNFALDGAHDKVACGQCHKDEIEKEGKTIRLYRGTPTRCADCHSDGHLHAVK
jgi:hypothetical protein